MKTVTNAMAAMTVGVDELHSQGLVPDLDGTLVLLSSGAREVPGWRTTYPMDDPANDPDLWIRDTAPILWIKRDDHEPPIDATGKCEWCGRRHAGSMAIFTVLSPDEW